MTHNFKEIWEELKKIPDEDFLCLEDRNILFEYLKEPSMVLMEMVNVRGRDVKIEPNLPFSFYFSSQKTVHNQHGIRVKIIWNPNKTNNGDMDGFMELHGSYDYTSGSHKYKPTSKELNLAREFFKKYKTLFSAVWENILDEGALQDYLEEVIGWNELLSSFNLDQYDEDSIELYNFYHCKNLKELEDCIRKYNIFNLNG